MKLLIVDDEELTRTGLISAIDWKSLGIDQIIQADDGIHGLEQARLYKPEIILCDVRMPPHERNHHAGTAGKASSGFCSCFYERLFG